MSGREDLNLRLLGPEPSALNQAEPRPEVADSQVKDSRALCQSILEEPSLYAYPYSVIVLIVTCLFGY